MKRKPQSARRTEEDPHSSNSEAAEVDRPESRREAEGQLA